MFCQGERVRTPQGFGTVAYVRMTPPIESMERCYGEAPPAATAYGPDGGVVRAGAPSRRSSQPASHRRGGRQAGHGGGGDQRTPWTPCAG